MKRREFIAGLGSAVTWTAMYIWPFSAKGQASGQTRRIGVLVGYAAGDPEMQERLAVFRLELERLGWTEGRNLRIDYRYAPAVTAEQAQPLARELIALRPDLIFAQGGQTTLALRRETQVLPIVFVNVSDPVGSGFIASLARPGGNMTGFLQYEASIATKWLDMLKKVAPRLTRAAFFGNPKTTPYDYFLRGAEAAARSLAVELLPSRVETAADIERVIETFSKLPNGGLLLPPDTTTVLHRDLIIALAARHRLPAVYAFGVFAVNGGLMSYGIFNTDMYLQAASYVDRILRGTEPADLPVQAPIRYETILKLKTAKALGLTIPETLLATADEVIQ
jgi:putative tryptophan/tyrosine transport system substrate-binding protein